ncbi:polysaccharide deacetylase family protein [Tissierella sp.]|uniref:polysaccharide deacetylase family protein n=1 Tax=Tissierella sp. TaxID=41274 RepID=UPI002860AE0C|nr:polysaccharide deacetylase family protein [Tissierella sp.]MDR7856220.1 polysaccharide deacetylase family protein [Tissierella sp.]
MRLIIINKKTLFTISIILFISLLLILATYIYNNKTEEIFNPDVYYKGNIDEKTIAFACNVDWGNDYIPPMLEIFKDNDIKITYFVTGKWAEKNEELLKMIYNEKHEIGNHGYNHADYDKLTYEKNREEILKTHDVIKSILNIDSKYFAPPSGAFSENTIKACSELDYNLILWSIDTIDWRKDSYKDIIVRRVTEKAHNAAIVLMHPTEETIKALPEIINYLYENGYKIGTISDVMKK